MNSAKFATSNAFLNYCDDLVERRPLHLHMSLKKRWRKTCFIFVENAKSERIFQRSAHQHLRGPLDFLT